jgi:hypothetical protein
MKFKEWFEKTGLTAYGFAKVCGLNRATIKNLVDGKTPQRKTVKILTARTKAMHTPVTWEMFDKVKGKRK